MSQNTSLTLKNSLLVAMPSLTDPFFKQSVIYIFEHSPESTMGMVINKPTDMMLDSIFKHLNIPINNSDVMKFPVLRGGPIAIEHGFILHREPTIGHGILANEKHNLVISASKEDLSTIPQDHLENIIVTLGYAGWEEGQLVKELAENSWIVAPFSEHILFDVPYDQRWQEAAKLVGVDINRIVGDVGHA